MLVTVYQKTIRGFIKVTEYYDWSKQVKPENDEEAETLRIACPGCGKNLSKRDIRFKHLCPGTLTKKPVEVFRPRWETSGVRQDVAKLQRYLQTREHKIIWSD
jgi:hypothetical protein